MHLLVLYVRYYGFLWPFVFQCMFMLFPWLNLEYVYTLTDLTLHNCHIINRYIYFYLWEIPIPFIFRYCYVLCEDLATTFIAENIMPHIFSHIGVVDPEYVYDALKQNMDYNRWLCLQIQRRLIVLLALL